MANGSPALPVDAATVILARDGESGVEVFLLRRSAASAFVPGHYVFPGGSVDASDRLLAGHGATTEDAIAMAAIRESFEEAGVLFAQPLPPGVAVAAMRVRGLAHERSFAEVLNDLNARPDPAALVPFSRWVTPAGQSRRFDARFFLARLPAGHVPSADGHETHDGVWRSAARALEEHASGVMPMIFPTVKHLERIATFRTVDELLAFARTKTIVSVTPSGSDGRFTLPAGMEDAW